MSEPIDSRLAFAYASYLCSPSQTIATELAELLRRSGFELEAACLKGCIERAADTIDTPTGPLAGRPVSLAEGPPSDTRVGSLWFAELELSTYVYLAEPGRPDASRWLRLTPVRAWQFEAFRLLVMLGGRQTEFPSPEDYLGRPAFPTTEVLVGDVYHDEALGHAYWFDRSLAGGYEWALARKLLKPEVFDVVLPGGWKFWDEPDFPGSESTRMAIGRTNIDLTASDLKAQFEAPSKPEEAVRGIFDEWERSAKIGFSTTIIPALGHEPDEEPPKTRFFAYENSVTFPSGKP
jgi:hypothetical protein